jgi:hypothetical protein
VADREEGDEGYGCSMREWVGPRCSKAGIKPWMKMSMSGITDRVRTSGMFRFVFSLFAAALLKMYPKAR